MPTAHALSRHRERYHRSRHKRRTDCTVIGRECAATSLPRLADTVQMDSAVGTVRPGRR